MRFLHTADWHLGRIFHGVSLTEDQHHALSRLIELLKDADVDAVLVAGDVYDRAVPPADAVELLDWALGEIVLGLGIPVIAIAGNHDSARRLAFCSRLLGRHGLHVFGGVSSSVTAVDLEDSTGPVTVFPLPYADPAEVRATLKDPSIRDHDTALRRQVGDILASDRRAGRRILVAHAFAAGGEESESERPLSIGGTSVVDADSFAPFDYVALGHLHRPQRVGSDSVRYSGSLLKYSFSEVAHQKAVLVVDVPADGPVTVEPVPLPSRRDLRVVEGTLEGILAEADKDPCREDYLAVRLLDAGVVFDAMGKLRDAYPNVLHVERPALEAGRLEGGSAVDHRRMSELDLFRAFFREASGIELSPAHESAFAAALESVRREETETAEAAS